MVHPSYNYYNSFVFWLLIQISMNVTLVFTIASSCAWTQREVLSVCALWGLVSPAMELTVNVSCLSHQEIAGNLIYCCFLFTPGNQCPSLLTPQNGDFNGLCDNRTEATCTFNCNLGYTLSGSATRTCSPSTTLWTGDMPICDLLHCDTLEPPDNGAILPPCINEFSQECTILCNFGYERQGPESRMCMVRSTNVTDEVLWSVAPQCVGEIHHYSDHS